MYRCTVFKTHAGAATTLLVAPWWRIGGSMVLDGGALVAHQLLASCELLNQHTPPRCRCTRTQKLKPLQSSPIAHEKGVWKMQLEEKGGSAFGSCGLGGWLVVGLVGFGWMGADCGKLVPLTAARSICSQHLAARSYPSSVISVDAKLPRNGNLRNQDKVDQIN